MSLRPRRLIQQRREPWLFSRREMDEMLSGLATAREEREARYRLRMHQAVLCFLAVVLLLGPVVMTGVALAWTGVR